MKLVLKGDFPAGNCVETPKRHLAGQKYWKKEVQVPEEVLANAAYYLDLQVLAPKGQPIEQCQKCRQESGRSSFVLVCCEGTRSTEEGLCIPLICPCLPTHQNKQATFELCVNIINRITREIEYQATLPISFRTGKKKRSDSLSPSPSPSSTRSSSPPPKMPKHKKSSNASSLGFPQRKDSSIVISPHPKENQLFTSSSFSNAASANWFANTASSIEFHWNAQPSQFLRQQQQLAQFNSQLAANGLLYQQEYETPLGQMTFKTAPPTGPSTTSSTNTNTNPTLAKPSSFFYEASTDYWLTDWLNEALAEGGHPQHHFHHSNVATQEGSNASSSSSSSSSHGDPNESGTGSHPHPHSHSHLHSHPHPHRIPIKGHLENAHSFPYPPFVGANNQPAEFEELFPTPAAGFNNFMTSAGSATPFYGQSY